MSAQSFLPGELYIGWAMEDITPDGPVCLYGQFYERISRYVQSPLSVTACAIESVGGHGEKDQAIMVSIDVTELRRDLQDALREMVKGLIPDFDVKKIFLNTTHTHSAPDSAVNSDYGKLLLEKMSKAVVAAWNSRSRAGISRVLGYATVGHNRRVRYADGTAEMYGATDRPDFIGLEGPADQGVNMMFCWDESGELTGIIMNVPCPAQVTEAKYYISADYWGEVRRLLETRFCKKVYILAQCGVAGDISPRDLPRGYKGGEPNMWDVPGMIEIGRRLAGTVMDAYPQARGNIQTKAAFRHVVKDISIPTRKVSDEEYNNALRIYTEIHSREPDDPDSPDTAWNRFLKEIEENEKVKEYGPWDNKKSDFGIMTIKDAVIKQYKSQHEHPFYTMELHVIRIGEIAIASNSFELFVDYGFQIMARSRAEQTFLVQLSGDYADYLATDIAIKGGDYSAEANFVGPEGGSVLVEETVATINSLWQ